MTDGGFTRSTAPAVDWREAFIKYVNIVAEREGVTFLDEEGWGRSWPQIRDAAVEAERRAPLYSELGDEGSGT